MDGLLTHKTFDSKAVLDKQNYEYYKLIKVLFLQIIHMSVNKASLAV